MSGVNFIANGYHLNKKRITTCPKSSTVELTKVVVLCKLMVNEEVLASNDLSSF